MKINFYINFDLSLRGDYKGLYKWLDKNNAEERGNGYALIKKYNFPDSKLEGIIKEIEKDKMLINYIRNDIKKFVEIGSSDRIYITFKTIGKNNLGGIFLFGRKQSAPWEGYYQKESKIEFDF